MLGRSKIKYIQSLGQKKFRELEGTFIAEGPKVVEDLMESGTAIIKQLYAVKEWIKENKKLLVNTTVVEITDAELKRISQLTTPNKVFAIVQQFEEDSAPVIKNKITLALDGIQDPGNMGTLIRIADWFGIKQIICSKESADIYNPKVVQATMGSIARVKILYTDLELWLADQEDVGIYAATLEGKSITVMKKITEGIIVIGNESKGINAAILKLATIKITIPKKGKAESLNAAVAAGIILSHLI